MPILAIYLSPVALCYVTQPHHCLFDLQVLAQTVAICFPHSNTGARGRLPPYERLNCLQASLMCVSHAAEAHSPALPGLFRSAGWLRRRFIRG